MLQVAAQLARNAVTALLASTVDGAKFLNFKELR
jgi:hypothetical protein